MGSTTDRPELAARIRRTGLIRLDELERHLLLVDARLYAAAWGLARGTPLVRWTNNPAAFPGADALAQFAAGNEIAAVAIRCDRPHERAGALERLGVQVEAGVLRAVWVLAQTGDDGPPSARGRVLSVATLAARPIA